MDKKSPFEALSAFAFYGYSDREDKIYYALIGKMKESKLPCVAIVRSNWDEVQRRAWSHGFDLQIPTNENFMPIQYRKELVRHLLRHLSL